MTEQKKLDGVPHLVEYQITVLVNDVPCTYNYYDQSEVVTALMRLKSLGKRYYMKSSVQPVH